MMMRFPQYSVALILMAWSLFLGACDDPEKEKAERDAYLKAYQESKKCDAEPVVIEIDGVEIAVPRRALVYRKEDDGSVSLQGKCDVKRVDGVRNAEWTERTEVIRVFSQDHPMSLGTFEAAKKYLKPFEIIDDGVEKAEGKTMSYYRISPEVLGATYKEPLLIHCDNFDPDNISKFADCRWYYDHPSGVGFGHKIWLKNYPGKSILEIFKFHEQRDQERVRSSNSSSMPKEGEQ